MVFKAISLPIFVPPRQLPGPDGNYYVTKADNIYTRWTAPEVLATLRHWLKSDVWSYGSILHLFCSKNKFFISYNFIANIRTLIIY